ncbi:MAG: enoyl-CoA hydratase/isomerase family protein [Alphaproteobacteria bacterium]|jgi:enoyl-CoA hydratase|nr:enoyl-CoA hydratase/isomerase family protein [Alphaproteobacteria bacterium]
MTDAADTQALIAERRGPLGLITLNRPKALNALTQEMIGAMHRTLDGWAEDPGVEAVVVRGAGDRAFCAGGDVVAIYRDGLAARAGESDGAVTRSFFRDEYRLDHRIHTYPKPYIALLDGLTMGGGVGISVHGRFRVATEAMVFAMPETGIGLFPDVGATWFLPRAPGETGTYLALTGRRCRTADCYYIGYATHDVPKPEIEGVIADLAAADWHGDPDRLIEEVLARHRQDPGPAPLASHRPVIDRCFGHDSLEAIVAALKAEGGPWAQETLETLATLSPTSLKLTLAALRRGKAMSYAECVTMEYRLTQFCMAGHDFFEGIRARLVDKDNAPQWDPADPAAVDDAAIDAAFAPLGEADLVVAP